MNMGVHVHPRGRSPVMEVNASNPPSSTSFPIILDHIFSYPAEYALPLRTMLTLNGRPMLHYLTTTGQPNVHPDAVLAAAQNCSTNPFIDHLSRQPAQTCSLPPSFITSFLRKCFPSELKMVDFSQALTALDYLRGLDTRRRREIVATLTRLGLERDNLSEAALERSKQYPGLLTWLRGIEETERKIEALYTNLFIVIRRWILINELHIAPYSKRNCIAMLNTLFPPVSSSPSPISPTPQLTAEVLSLQRDGYFKYITAVEEKGTSVLEDLMTRGKRPGDVNAWPNVRETLDKYLRLVNSVIDDCKQITSIDHFQQQGDDDDAKSTRKADSGVSFYSSSEDRPATGKVPHDKEQELKRKASPQPPSPGPTRSAPPSSPALSGIDLQSSNRSVGYSALERFAKEFRKLTNKRPSPEREINEDPAEIERPKTADPSRSRSAVRRVRSLGNLRGRSRSRSRTRDSPYDSPHVNDSYEFFDKDAMRMEREQYEARRRSP